jgi:hypothetical protein
MFSYLTYFIQKFYKFCISSATGNKLYYCSTQKFSFPSTLTGHILLHQLFVCLSSLLSISVFHSSLSRSSSYFPLPVLSPMFAISLPFFFFRSTFFAFVSLRLSPLLVSSSFSPLHVPSYLFVYFGIFFFLPSFLCFSFV